MSLISTALITVISAIAITILSRIYPTVSNYPSSPDIKTEMSWGQGS
jgi:hypothetical protein